MTPRVIRQCRGLAVVAALSASASLHAQAGSPPRYDSTLTCSRWSETVLSAVRTESGIHTLKESTGRAGVLELRVVAAGPRLEVEAWFDSLAVWRDENGERVAPETDGLIGGRYRGRLASQGSLETTDTPFVPDEVAEVADLSTVLANLLPVLPPRVLRVGEVWADSADLTITRLADSARSGRLERYTLAAHRERVISPTLPDSSPLPGRLEETEHGTYVWDRARGLLRWDRAIVTETQIPAGPSLPLPVRSRLEQRMVLNRLPAASCE